MDIEDSETGEIFKDSFKKELLPLVKDVGDKIVEHGLESFHIERLPFLKDVPFLSVIVSAYKLSKSVKEYYFIKKTTAFFYSFYGDSLTNEELQEFHARLEDDPQYYWKIKEFVLVSVDRFYDEKHSFLFGKLFQAHAKKEISWEELLNLTFPLQNMHPLCCKYLEEFMLINEHGIHKPRVPGEAYLLAAGLATRHGSGLFLTDDARKIYNICIKKQKST